MPKVKLKDVEIAYSTHGEGEPCVLIHGYMMVKEAWEQQVDGLSSHFRVITFDNRGVGDSTVPSRDFSIADMAADTVGLLDALDIDSTHIFGISMGGLIAQIIALDYPDRVRKVALGCTTHGGKHAVQPAKEVFEFLAANADPTKTPEEIVRNKVPVVFSEWFIREQPERLEELIQRGIQYFPTPEGISGQMKAMSVFNVKRRLHEIRCPVLAITGEEDKIIPAENSNLLAEGIPGAKSIILKDAAHAFYQERPDEVNKILIDFFKSS